MFDDVGSREDLEFSQKSRFRRNKKETAPSWSRFSLYQEDERLMS